VRGKFPLLNAVKRLWSDRSGFSLMHEAQRLISKNRRCATHVGSSEKHARSEEHPASVDRWIKSAVWKTARSKNSSFSLSLPNCVLEVKIQVRFVLSLSSPTTLQCQPLTSSLLNSKYKQNPSDLKTEVGRACMAVHYRKSVHRSRTVARKYSEEGLTS